MIKVWPVIHVFKATSAIKNARIAYECGAAGVMLISMTGDNDAVDAIADLVRMDNPGIKVGANYLAMPPGDAIERSQRRGYAASWIDQQCLTAGALTADASRLIAAMRADHQVFAAVAFKGQPLDYNPGAAAKLACTLGLIPTTSGPQTGVPPKLDKLRLIRESLRPGDRLALASGVTPDNIEHLAPFLTHVLVYTGISSTFYDFDEGLLRRLMTHPALATERQPS